MAFGHGSYGPVYVAAPLLRPLYLAKRAAVNALGDTARLNAAKRLGRRSPRLVSLYSRLRG
jgi:hypothetical protein